VAARSPNEVEVLTRLKVSGFKNLDGFDVQLGPFTCFFGENGVGKSNLFDAIAFLSALADKPLAHAAAMVRGSEGRVGDVRSLFQETASGRAPRMSFEAEMIIPARGEDDLGAPAEASMTYLRYGLTLGARKEGGPLGPLEILDEHLVHINKSDAAGRLGFEHTPSWRDSAITGRRTVPYIETEGVPGAALILTRQDSKGGGGGPRKVTAATMPRTVLSTANSAAEFRTMVLARREMMGWTQFQLEPSALRSPDPFGAPRTVASNGSHLAATLHGLAMNAERVEPGSGRDVYQRVANRLSSLLENVRTLEIDRDEKRELLSIVLTDLRNIRHFASALSDGTLRFLALTILEAGAPGPTTLCMEEPENGIHPNRIEAMVDLLQDLAVDVRAPIGEDNPLRQVIVNTHSPEVVKHVPRASLMHARTVETGPPNARRAVLQVTREAETSLLDLMPYVISPATRAPRARRDRLGDRPDLQMHLPLVDAGAVP
jgi:predicted ATPase